jgi:hypothetical protein
MQQIELTYLQMTLIGMGVGLILGLIPLILGIVKGKIKLAVGGFFASIAAGAIWSVIALLTVIVFVWLIVRKNPETNLAKYETPNENSTNAIIENSQNL